MNFKIPLIIYPFNILFYFGDDPIPFFKRKGMKLEEDDLEGCDGLTKFFECGDIGVILPKVPQTSYDYSVLQHEIFHAVAYTLRRVGIKLRKDSEESYAYLIDYLTKQCYTKLKFDERSK